MVEKLAVRLVLAAAIAVKNQISAQIPNAIMVTVKPVLNLFVFIVR